MSHFPFPHTALFFLAGVLWQCSSVAQDAPTASSQPVALRGLVPLETSLEAHLEMAAEQNPVLLAARRACDAAGLDVVSAKESFSAPSLSMAAGIGEDPVGVPMAGYTSGVSPDSLSAQAGVETPVASGVYGGIGARYRSLMTATEEDGDGVSSAGAYVRIPLLKDRGFAQNRWDVAALSQEERVAVHTYESTALDVFSSVTTAYAQYLYRLADGQEISNALARAEQLVADTTSRAEMEDVAEYQVFPARFEAATRAENVAEAKTQIHLARESLSQAIGSSAWEEDPLLDSAKANALLVRWAEALEAIDLAAVLAQDPAETCPEARAAKAAWEAAKAQVSSVSEAEKSRLDLSVAGGWNSEEDTTTLNEAGYEVALVYSRPLSRGGSRAKREAAEMRAKVAEQEYASALMQAKIRHEKAKATLESVRARRQLVKTTVEAARLVLEAENERFAIGDSSSRAVLDAQNDLTTAQRRELSVSLEVITAVAELFRSSGTPISGLN